MFSVERFYKAAQNCEHVDVTGFAEFARSFEDVVLWGAGHLGIEIGKKFIELHVPVSAYWDMRAAEIGTMNGIKVIEPFTGAYDKERTLIVFCISSSFVKDRLIKQIATEGYKNFLMGDYLYQGLICPVSEYDGLKVCRDSLACDAFTCERNEFLFRKRFTKEKGGIGKDLIFRNVTFIINQRCTLGCKYCYSYTNSYPPDKRVNFPLARIKKDIDVFFEAVDGVKFIPLIGGETFLHPDVSEIVRKFLEKTNFGILNVTTNGVCKISPRQLEGLQSDRIQVVFSNYKECLSSKQIEVFEKNIEFVKSSGAHVIVLNATPQWAVPTTLENKHYSEELMKEKKEACDNPLICKYVKNGRFYPCTIADSIYNLGIADYKEDYVEFIDGLPSIELRRRILSVLEAPYYKSCGHCDGVCGYLGLTAKAGEQGYYEAVNPVHIG